MFSALALPGCNPPKTSDSAPAAYDGPPISLNSPAESVRSLMQVLRAERQAVKPFRPNASKVYEDALLQIVAADAVEAALKQQPRIKSMFEREVMRGYVGQWGAVVAAYLDDMDLDRLYIVGSPDGPECTVLVPARSQGRSANIKVSVLKGGDGLWRVLKIGFAGAAPTSRPAASAPADV